MWSFRERRLIQREELLKAIASAQDIRGITVLGGEPLEQWANLKWLLDSLRADTALVAVAVALDMAGAAAAFRVARGASAAADTQRNE